MKILVIGKGGSEYALADCFKKHGHQVWCIPGSLKTAEIGEPVPVGWNRLTVSDHLELALFAKKNGVDLTVVGPLLPLTKGIADIFSNKGLPLFGPSKRASMIEASQIWAKTFMSRRQIPTAEFIVCRTNREAARAIDAYLSGWGSAVIRPDGLTDGGGAAVCNSLTEARSAVQKIMEDKQFGDAGRHIVIEKPLQGRKLSFSVLSDGTKWLPLLAPGEDKHAVGKAVIKPTMKGLQEEGIPYRGALSFEILCTDEGPKVLEYRCGLDDLKSEAILSLFEADPAEIMLSCSTGSLDRFIARNHHIC